MTFPLIGNKYRYKSKTWICWQQDLFRRVYLRSINYDGGSEYKVYSWWHFMFNAKKIIDNYNYGE